MILALPIQAQEVSVTLLNGSMLIGTLETKEIGLKTKYGVLRIPTKDIRGITVGVHFHKEYLDKLTLDIKRLDSTVHKERESAMQSLIKAQRHGYFLLKNATSLEVQARFVAIEEKIKESEKLDDDQSVINVFGASYKGHLVDDTIDINTEDLGPIKIHLARISQVLKESMSFTVSANSDWVDTGYVISRRRIAKATGEVDLWPATPKNWICGYKGHNTMGRVLGYNAGALICKIGPDGSPFVFDELEARSRTQKGNLYLHVVGNSWNTASSGRYTIELNGE